MPAPVYYEWRDDPGEGAIRSGARRRRSGCFRWHLGRLAFSERRRIAHLSTITTDANRQLAAIQERMLVILEMTDWPLWLGEIEGDVPALLRPLPEGVLRMWPIDKRFGQVRNDGPDLLEPLPEPKLALEPAPEPNLL